jgi:hypothetical protein
MTSTTWCDLYVIVIDWRLTVQQLIRHSPGGAMIAVYFVHLAPNVVSTGLHDAFSRGITSVNERFLIRVKSSSLISLLQPAT